MKIVKKSHIRESPASGPLRGTAGQITVFFIRGLIRRGGAPSGTAEGCGEDFRQKIVDCGGIHRKWGVWGVQPPSSDPEGIDFHRKSFLKTLTLQGVLHPEWMKQREF